MSFECFSLIAFASTVLSSRFWRIRKYFTPLLFLARISTYAKSIHFISLLNLANAFSLLNLRVARLNFVHECFQCKNCINFDAGRLLVFIKSQTDPYTASFACTIFAASDVLILKKDPAFPLLGCGILIQNQI